MMNAKQAAMRMDPPVSRSTVARWITHGVKINGIIVKLMADRIGSRWMIHDIDLERFKQECVAAGMINSRTEVAE